MSDSNFNRLDFVTAFHLFWAQEFRSHIIQSAWKKNERISFNSEMMVSKVRIRNLASRSRNRFFSFSFMNLMSRILKKSKEIIKMNQQISQRIANEKIISSNRMRTYIKESFAIADLLQMIKHDLKLTQTIFISRRARQKLIETIAQREIIIIVNDVRDNHIVRTQEKMKRTKTRERRVEVIR
jgi:hypothetical protein